MGGIQPKGTPLRKVDELNRHAAASQLAHEVTDVPVISGRSMIRTDDDQIFGCTRHCLFDCRWLEWLTYSGLMTSGNPKRTADFDPSEFEEGFMVYQADRDRVHYMNPAAV